ncbi:helix-turn-helix domain-containing protein [Kitasatospora arboriphila]
MIVGDLLELDGLGIRAAWTTPELLRRTVAGVTSTDLQDPARYLQPGEAVLTGLVWWNAEDASAALRFATSLRSAGVAALLAGEGTHGTVPEALAAACRTHRIPLLSVPAAPASGPSPTGSTCDSGATCRPLRTAPPRCRRASAGSSRPCCRATPRRSGCWTSPRPGSACPTARSPRRAAGCSPGRARQTPARRGHRLGRPDRRPRRITVRGLAAAAARAPRRRGRHRVAGARRSARAGRRPGRGRRRGPPRARGAAVRGAGPGRARARRRPGRLRTRRRRRTDRRGRQDRRRPRGLGLRGAGRGAARDGGAVRRRSGPPGRRLRPHRRRTGRDHPRATGRAAPVAVPADRAADPAGGRRTGGGRGGADALRGALVQAAYALESAPAGTVASSAETDSLAALLLGTPPEVRAAFHHRLLAPLAAHDRANAVSLLGTLDAFLAHDCSWTRTAEALHLHVNTVHYRLRRIEELTGRSLARLQDRLDLRAALLCAPAAGPDRAPAARPRAAAGARRR